MKRDSRRGFDLIFDSLHWNGLCAVACRKLGTSPTRALCGILEKVLKDDLKMLSAEDDLLDRPLHVAQTHLKKLRQHPEELKSFLARRGEELLTLAELFPRELRNGSHAQPSKKKFQAEVCELMSIMNIPIPYPWSE